VTKSRPVEVDEAFEQLFTKEYRRVASIASRIVGDGDEAEDVAQDVFVSFARSQDRTSPGAPGWLYRAAVHLALNAVRSRKRRWRHHETEARSTAPLDQARSHMGDPAQSVEIEEQREAVRDTLKRLPEKSASVLALRYSGLSYAEVAAAIGCGVGDVGTLLRRAEQAFRKEMQRETR